MRFHVLGLCHTVSSREYVACAFTQKVVKFCEMMQPRNETELELKRSLSDDILVKHPTIHRVYHYGHERSDVPCDEHITVTDDKLLRETYGDYNWKKDFFKHSGGDKAHRTFSANAIKEIQSRIRNGDFILCFWGLGHAEVAYFFRNVAIIVEPGIGYPTESSICDKNINVFKVFESYAIMNVHYGESKIKNKDTISLPPAYDCVIPNYFDPKDFDFQKEKGNYFLYLGRLIKFKGLDIVLCLARKLGFRLVLAGQGDLYNGECPQKDIPANIEHVGYADVEKRRKLLAGARALFLPTQYIEPFGGTTMEAMMSGTPVITTDWGVFAETVLHGVTGYRCRNMDQFEWAVRNIDKIDPQACRDWALNNYSNDRIRLMFEEYFDMLVKVKLDKGYHLENLDRQEMSWLTKYYPVESCWPQVSFPGRSDMSRVCPRRPRLAFFTEPQWAFGRIAHAVQKYSHKFDVDIIDWKHNGGSDDRNLLRRRLGTYDLVYATVWDVALRYILENPLDPNNKKIVFSGHGLVDFVKMGLSDKTNRQITVEDVTNFRVDPNLMKWLRTCDLPLSVVSHELQDRLTADDLEDHLSDSQVYLTMCGADSEYVVAFPNLECESEVLGVLVPMPR